MFQLIIINCLLALILGAIGSALNRPGERIIGGYQTDIKNVPYIVAVEYIAVQYCAGSIITPKFVLTSAHCFDRYNASEVQIRYGSNLQFDPQSPNVVKVSNITIHSKYNNTEVEFMNWAMDYDVAIAELEEEIVLSDSAQTIKLTDTDIEPANGTAILVSGWGYLELGLYPSPYLRSIELNTIPREDCEEDYQNYYPVTERMFCGGEGGKGFCWGDNGGPAVVGEPGNETQIGIVSWSLDCAEPDFPGVYTNIANSEIRSFIRDVAGV